MLLLVVLSAIWAVCKPLTPMEKMLIHHSSVIHTLGYRQQWPILDG
jgi:hypothetical protein